LGDLKALDQGVKKNNVHFILVRTNFSALRWIAAFKYFLKARLFFQKNWKYPLKVVT